MDQAQSLREIMRASTGKVISRAHSVPVISVIGARPGDGASFVAQALARVSAQAGARTLLVAPPGSRTSGMVRADAGYFSASAVFVRDELRGGEWDDFGFASFVLDAGAELDEERLAYHDPAYRSVVVLTPSEASFFQAYKHIKLLGARAGVKKVDVVVNRARDEREGLQVFSRLQDVAGRFLAVDFSYAGSIREKSEGGESCRLTDPKILLDWNTEARGPFADVLPIAKKLGLSAQ